MTTTENEQRDELARTINGGLRNGVTVDDFRKQQLGNDSIGEYIAEAIRNLGYRKPRTITTAEELGALPEGSVVRETDGRATEAFEAWNRDESSFGIQFLETGTSWRLESREITFPAAVLWEPEVEVGA